MSPHKGGVVALVSDNIRGETRKLLDVMPELIIVRIAHPSFRARHYNAATDGVNEKTQSDAHGHGMRPSGDAGLPNDAGELVAHGLGVLWPEELAGVVAGLGADVMHLFKKG